MAVHDVCVVGSANLDLVAGAPRHPAPGETVLGTAYDEYPGGKGLNQAVSAARSGARVAFVGAVGDDEAGRRLVDVLDHVGIDRSSVETVDAPTGRALIVVDAGGENSIVVVAGANGLVAVGDAPPSAVTLCQLEIPAVVVQEAMARAKAAGSITVLNPAPAQALTSELTQACDVIVPNEHEVELLGGAAALLDAGCGSVVVTRGADGVDVFADGVVRHREALEVEVVDTTGAGDAFCGALCARLAAGDSVWDATEWAVAAGALATTSHGAVPAQPTADAIRALLAEVGEG